MLNLKIKPDILEAKFTAKAIKLMNSIDPDKIDVYKRFGGVGNENGRPDITGHAYGFAIELESKRPMRMSLAAKKLADRLAELYTLDCLDSQDLEEIVSLFWKLCDENFHLASPLQQKRITDLQNAGVIAGVVTCLEQGLVAIGLAKSQYDQIKSYRQFFSFPIQG